METEAQRLDRSLLLSTTTKFWWWTQFKLTQREMEVAALMVQGLKQAEIARRLLIAESTTRDHVRNIIDKVGAENAFHAALVLGMTQPPVTEPSRRTDPP